MAGLIKNSNLLNFASTANRTGENANNLAPGMYSIYVGASYINNNYPAEYGVLLVFTAYNDTKLQFMASVDNHLYYRSKWESWGSWKQIV